MNACRYDFNCPKVSMASGVVGQLDCSFTCGNDKSTIKIVKNESDKLSYKVSLFYLGIKNTLPQWTFKINKKPLLLDDQCLIYSGSRSFVIRSAGERTIEIQETDANETESTWINISVEKNTVYNIPSIKKEPTDATAHIKSEAKLIRSTR